MDKKDVVQVIGAVAAGTLLGSCSTSSAEQLIIMGAASTRVINEDLQAEVEDTSLEFNNAGSGTLVSQLEEGAPGDVFISADKEAMDKAIAAGVVVDPVEVATNSLVVIVPKDNPAKITSFADLGSADAVITVYDEQVPCGRVAKELEEVNNITIQADSLEQSVSDVAGKVSSGEADAGLVYATDAAALGDSVRSIDIPHAQEHRNTLMAAVVKNSANQAKAAEIVGLLAGKDFAVTWEKHGFDPVSG